MGIKHVHSCSDCDLEILWDQKAQTLLEEIIAYINSINSRGADTVNYITKYQTEIVHVTDPSGLITVTVA